MNNIGFVSLGCSKNLVDTEIMAGLVKKGGLSIVTDESKADVIIVNTCGFIESAKEEAISTILEMAEYKRSGRLKKLIVTGCLAERYRDEILREMPEVDAVVGVGRFSEIYDVITSAESSFFGNEDGAYPEHAPRILSTPSYTAYVKIAEGCDNHCTYCAIPKIRGRYRSRRIEDIVKEVEGLAEGGVKELNVIAQDTTRYGIDLYNEPMLTQLLEKISAVSGIKLVRVLYTYPEMITDGLIELVKNNEKIAKYFDIPLQHSEDSVLKRMGRKSNNAGICALISKIRREIPGAVIRTSLIVGFPGESGEEFEGLCEFVKWARFDRMGVFKYSREEGTPADLLDGHLDEEVKEERYMKLMEMQQGISRELNRERIGQTMTVLIEGRVGSRYFGRTQFDAPEIDGRVYVKTKTALAPGDFVRVRITGARNYDLIGEMDFESAE